MAVQASVHSDRAVNVGSPTAPSSRAAASPPSGRGIAATSDRAVHVGAAGGEGIAVRSAGFAAGGAASRRDAYVAKTRGELHALANSGVVAVGNAFAPVLLVKGELDDAERGGALLAGDDGRALRAALTALGYAPQEWCGLSTVRADGTKLSASALRVAIVAFDPATLIACDSTAAEQVREAFAVEFSALPSLEAALFVPGLVVSAAGMRMLNLGGFAEALAAGDAAKQRAWAWLKQVPPLGEPY